MNLNTTYILPALNVAIVKEKEQNYKKASLKIQRKKREKPCGVQQRCEVEVPCEMDRACPLQETSAQIPGLGKFYRSIVLPVLISLGFRNMNLWRVD